MAKGKNQISGLNGVIKTVKEKIKYLTGEAPKNSQIEIYIGSGVISLEFENKKVKLTFEITQSNGAFFYVNTGTYYLD